MKLVTYLFNKFLLLVAIFCTLIFNNAFATERIQHNDFKQQWDTGWELSSKAPSALSWKRISTEGDGQPAQVFTSIKPTNLTAKIIDVNLRINSIDFLGGVEIRFSAKPNFDTFTSFSIPIFDDLEFNLLQEKAWHRLTFGLGNAQFNGTTPTDTFKYIAIYVQDNTIAPIILDFTDIQIKDAQHQAILSYTFDDGYQNQILAAEIMAQKGHAGTAYIIVDFIDEPGYLTLSQAKQLNKLGWGLSFHHYEPFTHFSSKQLIQAFNDGFDFFKEHKISTAMRHLAYPLGKQNRTNVLPLTRHYFSSARIAGAGMETLPPSDWSLLRTVNVMPSTSVEDIRNLVRKAKNSHQWLILMFHHIVEDPTNELEYPKSKFKEITNVIAEEKILVLPIHQVWNKLAN